MSDKDLKLEQVILVLEDDTLETVSLDISVKSLLDKLKTKNVKTVCVGETNMYGKVKWEKQFNSVTVMPNRRS